MFKKILTFSFLAAFMSCNNQDNIIEKEINQVVHYVHPANDFIVDSNLTYEKINELYKERPNYFRNGKFRNMNMANYPIAKLFTDWEILFILKRNEGYYSGNSRIAISHNNPCNIKYGPHAKKYNGTKGIKEVFYGEGDNYANFNNVEDGNTACLELIKKIRTNHPTVQKFFTKWSTVESGIRYVKFVNDLMNVDDYPMDFVGSFEY